MKVRAGLGVVALLGASACGGAERDAPAGAGGGAGSAGLAGPERYLTPSAYDCRASSAVEPPSRPHPPSCHRDVSCSSPVIVAHRVATPFAPENSLSALRAAILLGVDIVETDVRLSADGQVVLIHDATVERTFQGSGAVSELTLAELAQLPMKVNPDLSGEFGCDRVPTLGEVFAIAKGRIIVELEVKDTAAGVESARYLRDNGLYDHAFLLCSPSECAAARAEVPDVPIMSRPSTLEAIDAEIAYDPPPILVHTDATDAYTTAAVIAKIHGVGAKLFQNAFTNADADAIFTQSLASYPKRFEAGVDVLQTEYPHFALTALGRLTPE